MRELEEERIVAMCEKCGWYVRETGDEWELENMEAPFILYARPEDIKTEAKAAYDDFDEDEFCAMYLEAKKNGLKGVPGIRGLLEAAEKICNDLEALAINSAAECY